MIVFLTILILVIFNNLSVSPEGEFNTDYLNKKNTTSINGIFVILVFFSHYVQYTDFGGAYDDPYLLLRGHLGQMVVVPFLFYSGYGMMEAIKSRGNTYVDGLPEKFIQLLFKFDVAVLAYHITNIIIGREYPTNHILLAYTTWTSIGNSNWYITAVLSIYICTYISFKVCSAGGKNRRTASILLLTILTICCVYVQMKIDRPPYCYNTMILMPLGFLYSRYKNVLESVIQKNDIAYWLALCLSSAIYIVSFLNKDKYGIEGYTIWAISFMGTLLLITMKASVYNRALEWAGRHIFSIYILQRLPMAVLAKIGFVENHKYMGLILAFCITVPIALIFEKATDSVIAKAKYTLKKQR